MKMVERNEAIARRTHCQYVHGQGFLDHGAPPALPADASGTANCVPDDGAQNGSVHIMRTPGGTEMNMIWHADEGAWGATVLGKGNRLAWTPEHLSKAGWEYLRPIDEVRKDKLRRGRRSPLVRRSDSR